MGDFILSDLASLCFILYIARDPMTIELFNIRYTKPDFNLFILNTTRLKESPPITEEGDQN